MGDAGPRVQQPQEGSQFGQGGQGAARLSGRISLGNRHHGRQARQRIERGAGQQIEPGPGVGGKDFQAAALPFGKQRVERQ